MQLSAHGRITHLVALLGALALLPPAGLFLLAALPGLAAGGLLDSAGLTAYRERILNRLTLPHLAPAGGLLLLGALLLAYRRGLAARLVVFAREARADLAALARLTREQAADRRAILAVLALTALAAAVRLPFLFQPMRYDEAFTYCAYAAPSLFDAVSQYQYPNNHVGHTVCVALATRALGADPWAIRLPVFIAGVLLVPAVYLLGQLLHDRGTALLGAALVGGSSLLVEYSTNARGYVIVSLCFVLQAALGCVVLRQPSSLAWAAWAGVAALGMWTVPTALLATGAVVLWLAACALCRPPAGQQRGEFLRRLAGAGFLAGALTALLYSPVLLVSGPEALFGNKYVRSLDWAAWRQDLPASLASTWGLWNRDHVWPITALLAAGFLVALLAHRRLSRQPAPLALLTLAFCALFVTARQVVPFERVWLFALPLYLVTAAAGLAALARWVPTGRRGASAGLLVLAVGLGVQTLVSGSVNSSTETGTLPDGPGMAAALREHLRPGDRVVAACPSDAVLAYYFRRLDVPAVYLESARPPVLGADARLYLVVNRAHGQTLDDLTRRYRLGQVVDLEEGQLVRSSQTADLFAFPAAPAGVAGVHRRDR
jgi:hypothetical protein